MTLVVAIIKETSPLVNPIYRKLSVACSSQQKAFHQGNYAKLHTTGLI